jgi:uncharacterized protein YdeI (YjbR/CyaY-like superfamily)
VPKAASRDFASAAAFGAWLRAHHATAVELFVRCRKVGVDAPGLTYKEALDEALCAGWIDGVRHALDAASFSVRFTPRKKGSAWSAVNVRRYRELEAAGRVRAPGRAAFGAGRRSAYSYETRPQELAPAYRRRFRAERAAWSFFQECPPWYRRTCAYWVMSAKQEETRLRRLELLIACSGRAEGLPALKPPRVPARRPTSR